MDTRNIVVITGSRAEYGLLKSTMKEIKQHDSLSLSVIATGMHLSPDHGYTVNEIEKDGFKVDYKVNMVLDGDSGKSMAKSLGIGTSSLAESFDSIDPDMLIVLGDRDEPLAAVLAASHMNIPSAHIHGGDITQGGTIDDDVRHAITKLAHIHFPASEKSAERIRNLGEQDWRITTVGAPGLDDILKKNYTPTHKILSKYNLDPDKKFILVVQHPVTTQADKAGKQMKITLDAISEFDSNGVIIYPNSDSGGKKIIEKIKSHELSDDFLTFKNLPRSEYLSFMKMADVMVGNSSSGIIEAPLFGIPVVDIGSRQKNRERCENVISVEHKKDEIKDAVYKCLNNEEIKKNAKNCDNPYYKGGAGILIARKIAEIKLDKGIIKKQHKILNHD